MSVCYLSYVVSRTGRLRVSRAGLIVDLISSVGSGIPFAASGLCGRVVFFFLFSRVFRPLSATTPVRPPPRPRSLTLAPPRHCYPLRRVVGGVTRRHRFRSLRCTRRHARTVSQTCSTCSPRTRPRLTRRRRTRAPPPSITPVTTATTLPPSCCWSGYAAIAAGLLLAWTFGAARLC